MSIPDHILREAVKAERARRILAARARADVVEWCRQGPHTLRGAMVPHGWQGHIGRILQGSIGRLVDGGHGGAVRILLIDAPQQSGKSEIVKRAAAMALASGLSVGVLAYNEEFAREWGRDMRRLMRSPAAVATWPHLRVPDGPGHEGARRDQSDAATRWTVPHPVADRPPVRFASTGRRGGLEGLPLDVVIADDLYKTIGDAQSPANVRQVEDLLLSSALGRVADRGGEIWDIGTRRGSTDSKGFWIRKREEVEAAGLTMEIARHSYPLRGPESWRYGPRGYLTPGWTEAKEAAQRVILGRWAAPLLDGEDVDAVGGLFPPEALSHTYPDHPDHVRASASELWVSMDSAQTEGAGDWTAIQVIAIRGECHDLIYQDRGQWDELGVIRRLRAVLEDYRPQRALVEGASSGRVAVLALRSMFPQLEEVPTSGRGSKRDQIQGTLSLWMLGRVRLPEARHGAAVSWCYGHDADGLDLRARLLRLRGDRPDMRGEVDDEADALCQALRYRLEAAPVRDHGEYWEALSGLGW
jgi:hypothetical protein